MENRRMNPTAPVTVRSVDELLTRMASTHKDARIRIDNRPTVEIGWTTSVDKYGIAHIVPTGKRVERVACFLHRPGGTWVKTESGDIWPVKVHPKANIANFQALLH
jgi:hypothetical protein